MQLLVEREVLQAAEVLVGVCNAGQLGGAINRRAVAEILKQMLERAAQ